MKKIHILHISDLHVMPSTDTSDHGETRVPFSEDFITEIAGSGLLSRFIACITNRNLSNKIHVIAFTGDLGIGTHEHTLSYGIEFLNTLAKDIAIPPEHVVVCPGNHDLNREAARGTELEEFCRQCSSKGFHSPNHTEPVVVDSFGPLIIALNSCLGGTEHAPIGAVPDTFWKFVTDKLREFEGELVTEKIIDEVQEFKEQLTALDIPAIGYTQLDSVTDEIVKNDCNCALILMHHDMLPTGQTILRPYANVIDAGRSIQHLIEQGHRIVLLHGHTHIESGISAFLHQEEKKGGFLASIGSSGFHNNETASANLIELWVTNNNDFLKLHVTSVVRVGGDFQCHHKYILYDRDRPLDEDFKKKVRDSLKLNETHSFLHTAKLIDLPPDDYLADNGLPPPKGVQL